jgi:hypothetical protein
VLVEPNSRVTLSEAKVKGNYQARLHSDGSRGSQAGGWKGCSGGQRHSNRESENDSR